MSTAGGDRRNNRPEELVLYGMAECMAGEVTGEVKLDLWNAVVPILPVIAMDENANSTDAGMLPGNDRSVVAQSNLGVEHQLDRLVRRHTPLVEVAPARPSTASRAGVQGAERPDPLPDPPPVVIQTVKPSS